MSEQRLRVVPDPDSAVALADPGSLSWDRDVDQDDWCVDARVGSAASCTEIDDGAASMSARERRAVLLSRQRARAQAVLATASPRGERERRDRALQLVIWVGSGLVHLGAFALLAWAVADLEPRQPAHARHEHLFEAPAVVPIELEQMPAPIELEVASTDLDTAEPRRPASERHAKPAPSASPDPEPQPTHDHEPAPYALEGFELSSKGEFAAGEGEGEAWGRPGGSGSGSGSGGGSADHVDHSDHGSASDELDASPRGGLVEPEYPSDLERRGVEGVVVVKVWIDEHGHVIKAEVVESSRHEAFDHNALMAAQRQEWTPAQRGGHAVSSSRRYRVRFRLPAP